MIPLPARRGGDLQGKDCSDGHGCPNAADAGCVGAAQQSFCISAISAIAPCIALTSSVPAGRLAVRRRKLRLQGKDCSYNPIAFPPSLVVRRRTTAGMQEVEQRRERLPR